MPGIIPTEECHRLRKCFEKVDVPVYGLRGNHDHNNFLKFCEWLIPEDAESHFIPSDSPLYLWNVQWWDEVGANAISLSKNSNLPEPYNSIAQPQVVKLIDGIGPYYSFDRSGYHFIGLETCRWFLGKKQFDWLSKNLRANNTKPTIIFMHHSILPTGSIYDEAILWGNERLISLIQANPQALGIFSGHVHYNRIWDFEGVKIVTTGVRDCRRIVLEDGKIVEIELLESYEKMDDPFLGRYFMPSGILAPSFRCSAPDVWNFPVGSEYGTLAWISNDSPGGLVWTLHIPEVQSSKPVWFGISFNVKSSWRFCLYDMDEEVLFETRGSGGSPVALSEKVTFPQKGEYIARLEQDPPAIGHACPYFSIGLRKLYSVNVYPEGRNK